MNLPDSIAKHRGAFWNCISLARAQQLSKQISAAYPNSTLAENQLPLGPCRLDVGFGPALGSKLIGMVVRTGV
jgi:hypothetical protein